MGQLIFLICASVYVLIGIALTSLLKRLQPDEDPKDRIKFDLGVYFFNATLWPLTVILGLGLFIYLLPYLLRRERSRTTR